MPEAPDTDLEAEVIAPDQWVNLLSIYEAGRVAKEAGDDEELAAAQEKLDALGEDVVTETPFIVKIQQVCDAMKA